MNIYVKREKNERNKELNQYRYTATTVHPESQVWVSCTQLWVSPLAGYLLWVDTSISQIPPLARYLLWGRYLLWLEISVGQTPSITWHLLRQHISFWNIYLSAAYLLWQNISSSNISPLATYLLQQHVLFFPQLRNNQAVSIPFDWLLLRLSNVHPATVGSWRISSFSPCASWRATNLLITCILDAETQSSNFSWAYHAL